MKTLRIEEMTWQQVKQAMEQGYRRVIFALGSIEQHGPHLPLVTDALIGDALALRVAEKLGETLVAPTPRRAKRAEEVLRGKALTEERSREAARVAVTESAPIDDVRGSAWYRREMVELLTRRQLSAIRDHP